MTNISFLKKMGECHKYHRCGLSDYLLLCYYRTILWQCKHLGRSDRTLIEYINELEYRDLYYEED